MKYSQEELRKRLETERSLRLSVTPAEYEELEQNGFVLAIYQNTDLKGKRICTVSLPVVTD